jgi:hypothetical protein
MDWYNFSIPKCLPEEVFPKRMKETIDEQTIYIIQFHGTMK